MLDNKDGELPMPKTRKFPITLGIVATVLLYILSANGSGVIIRGLAELIFTLSLFLILTAVFKDIVPPLINALLQRKKSAEKTGAKPSAETAAPAADAVSDGLIEIRKENVSPEVQARPHFWRRIAEIAYVLFFCGIAFWRVRATMTRFPVVLTEYYRSTIAVAALLLVFPCIALIYLKMRKDEGECPGDSASRDMLTLFSYVSVFYAAVITASSALKVNFIIILPWVYGIVLVYLVGALALNILFSILRDDVLGNCNYTLFPSILKTKGKKDGILDSQEVQQNFSLKSLYTIQYAVKILPGVLLGLGFALFVSTTVFVVQPHQQALVYHWGQPSPVIGEGIHVKFPWPIDKADIYDVHRVNSMQIGYASPYSAHYLWTRAHAGGENTLLTGNGNEMVAVNIKIMYTITDLYSYVRNCTNPEAILSAAAYTALMLRTVDTTLDEFLSVDRTSLSASVADELAAFCAENGLGLSVQQVIVESIHPPVDVADYYQRVVTSLVVKNTLITRAETEAAQKIIAAQQENRTAIYNALSRRHGRISEAQKEMAVYYAAMEAHRIHPASLELRKYLDTYERIINGNKVYVFSPGMESAIGKSVIGNANVAGVNYE